MPRLAFSTAQRGWCSYRRIKLIVRHIAAVDDVPESREQKSAGLGHSGKLLHPRSARNVCFWAEAERPEWEGNRTLNRIHAIPLSVKDAKPNDISLRDAQLILRRGERPLPSDRRLDVIRDFEARDDIALPPEFASYLRTASPSEDWMDEGGIIWWAPERIHTLREEWRRDPSPAQRNAEIEDDAGSYLIFADFLDWCYAYAICCNDGPNSGKVALVGLNPDRFVASSFETFVSLAAVDSDRLHSPVGDHFLDVI